MKAWELFQPPIQNFQPPHLPMLQHFGGMFDGPRVNSGKQQVELVQNLKLKAP